MKHSPKLAIVVLLALGATVAVLLSRRDLAPARPSGPSVRMAAAAAPRPAKATPAPVLQPPAGAPIGVPSRVARPLWAPAIAMEGQKLDPLSALYGSMPRTLRPAGRTAYFDANVLAPLARLQKDDEVALPFMGNERLTGRVNLVQTEPSGLTRVGGSLTGAAKGSFSLAGTNQEMTGRILLPDQRLAYEITSPRTGQMVMRETDLADVLCYRMPRHNPSPTLQAAALAPQESAPLLSSRPSAPAVLYLVFDGATVTDPSWNSGNTIVAAPAVVTSAQITEIWNRVKEDYWPFNIDVTTNPSRYNGTAAGHRMRVIITPTDTADPGAGGVAYVSSFSQAGTNYKSDIPCWVFNTDVVGISEAVSHELGHTLGLHHDGLTSPVEEYYTGANGWGPIMGSSYDQALIQWSKGEYLYANNQEDDVAIIANTGINGFGYVADTGGDSRAAAAALTLSGTTFSQTGLIITAADSDYYSFTVTTSKAVSIDAEPAAYSPDLDIALELQDANGNVLASDNQYWQMNATITACPVVAGTYYVKISGSGRGDPVNGGYSNYGSIGYYSLTGSIVAGPPPVAPTISGQPAAVAAYVGDSVNFSVYATGTSPLAYQWSKDGVALADGSRISGSSTSYLTITNAQSTDAGNYTVVVRNAQGSVTSNNAALTISAVPPPTFSSQPYDTTVAEGNNLSYYCYANGRGTITYQWYKDNQPLSGQTSYYFSKQNVTFADAGVYQLSATNIGGTTMSQAATVTVIAATLPVIVTQPQSQDLYAGQSFQLGVYATSNAPESYQWYRNGVPIANASFSNYYGSSAAATDAGIYTVVVSTASGSTTSAAAFVTVATNLPPTITSQPTGTSWGALGNSAQFSVTALGAPPLTYQWYHNGSAIPGASSSTFYINSIAATDVGEYYVNVSNSYGTTVSNSAFLTLNTSNQPGFYWLDARQQGSVVYFLHAIPQKIARFDLTSGTWLAPWALTQTPTAFAIGSDAIYVAYGASVVRYDSSFSGATALCTAPQSIGALIVAGQYLITFGANNYPYTNINSYNRTSGVSIAQTSRLYSLAQGYSYCASGSCVLGMNIGSSISTIYRLPINADGTFGADQSSGYFYTFPGGQRTIMFADDIHITDDDGVVYNVADLTYTGSLGGQVNDVVSAQNSGYYTLFGTTIRSHDSQYRQTASTRINICASRLFLSGSILYAFAQPTSLGSAPTVQAVNIAQIQPPPVAPALNARGRSLRTPALVSDENGVLYVGISTGSNIFRWSMEGRRYLRPIPLTAAPSSLAYSAANRALYYTKNGTQMQAILLDSGSFTEAPLFSSPPGGIAGMQSAGNDLFVVDGLYGYSFLDILSPSAAILSRTNESYLGSYPQTYTWNATNRRMYSLGGGYGGLQYFTVAVDGTIAGGGSTSYSSSLAMTLPVRVSPDGAVALLGSGNLFDAVSMNYLGTLPTTNVTDAAWTTGTLHLLHATNTGTEVQSIPTSTYQIERSASFPGKPLALFARSDNRLLLVTTTLDSYLQYYQLEAADLSVISHDDTRGATVAHDFDGDGNEDLVWQDPATGRVTIWLMNGTLVASSAVVGTMDPSWRLAAAGDINGDGRPEIIWQNTQTGEFGYWTMKGTINTGFVSLGTAAANARIVGLADFNDDGQSDLVWQDTVTGICSVSLMNRGSVGNSIALGSVGTSALVVAAGDFNGDGNPDLVVQNTSTGAYAIRLTQQMALGASVSLGTRSSDWQVAATGDFNGDGAVDLVWVNSTAGASELWSMNGTSATGTIALPPARLNDQPFIRVLMADVLNRPADPDGLASLGALLAGDGSRADALGALLGSTEYGARQVEPAIRLYYAALARLPDYPGLQNWSNALGSHTLSLVGAADQFAGSAEFLLRYGTLDNTGYVQQLYRNVLGREADPAGLADWVGQLDRGASRGTILVGFSESDEFKANLADQVEILRLFFLLLHRLPTAAEFQGWLDFLRGLGQTDVLLAQACPFGLADTDLVQAVFHAFLRRDADAGALSSFSTALAGSAITPGGMVQSVMDSAEFTQFVAPVSRLYLAALRRVPDQPGLDNWVNFVRAGNSLQMMAEAFAASPEFTNRYGAMSNQDYVAQLYRDVLGREADPAGLAYWTGQLDSSTATRGGILIGFSESQEAIHLFAPTLRTFLDYFAFLDSAPTQANLDYWKTYRATLVDQMREAVLDDPAFTNGG